MQNNVLIVRAARLFAAAAALAAPMLAGAADAAPTEVAEAAQLSEVTVAGLRDPGKIVLTDEIEGLPGQTYVIGRDTLDALPFSDATDLLRQTPGITIGPSSPTADIGDDISIRGFSSFHGADAAVFIDGVPVNAPNGPNRHGAVDFNWLTPDLIERIEVIKGPFSALYGNYNLSGAINIITKSKDKTSATLRAGSYGNYSGGAVYGREHAGITPFIAFDYLDRDGYRDRANYKRVNSFNKISFPVADGTLALRFNASFRESRGPGFLSVDDVRSGAVDRRSATAGSIFDRGSNDYYTFVANYVPKGLTGLSATAYAGRDEFTFFDTAFNTPTASPDPADPTFEPTSFSTAERNYAGWRIQHSSNALWKDRLLLTVGSDGQFDDGTVIAGTAVNGRADDVVENQSRNQRAESIQAGLFAQGQVLLHSTFKLVGGLRWDYIGTRVLNNVFADNSGQHDQSTLTPKIGAVFTPIRAIELFTNYGGGFRSAAATELSQNRAGATFNDSLGVAKLESVDAGVVLRLPLGLKVSGDVFTTTTKRELRRGANAGNSFEVVNVGTTDREGYELSVEWQVLDSLRLQASHVGVETQLKNIATPGADRIITVPDDTQTVSASWSGATGAYKLNADFFGQRVGRRPLTADGSVYDDGYIRYGVKGRAARGAISATLGVDYFPERLTSDFAFLNGPVIFDPQPRFNVSGSIKYTFD